MSENGEQKISIKEGIALIRRGLGLIRRQAPWYLTCLAVSSVIKGVRPFIALYFSARILDELTGARDLKRILLFAALTVGISFLLTAADACLTRKVKAFQVTFFPRSIHVRAERYESLDYEYVEQTRITERLEDLYQREMATSFGLSKVFDDFPHVVQHFSGFLASLALAGGLFCIPGIRSGSFVASRWSLLLLAVLIFLVFAIRVYGIGKAAACIHRLQANVPKENVLSNYYHEYAKTAAKDIRLYAQQDVVSGALSRGELAWQVPFLHAIGLEGGLAGLANALVGGCVYLLIGLRALAGLYTIGQVTQYVGAVILMFDNLSELLSDFSDLWKNNPSVKLLFDYLDLPDIKYKGTLTTEKRSDNDYQIEFCNVSFRYPGRTEYALRNLNLKLKVGERLAVVGMNGSGKTTMIKLLCRLYDPTEGMITLNGIDIRKYDYQEYMALFSVVFQDFKLPAFPLGQDVAAAVEYDSDRVLQSLRQVGFDAQQKLINGLDTPLYKDYDENGVQVSGGEAQKIAMARALYRNAPFIVLDEPTAALDPIAESEIYTRFSEIVGEKTAVYISHRLSSCRFCDKIAVFHRGSLVQSGSHDELLEDIQGQYYELWNAQAQYYTEKTGGQK